MDSVYSPSGIIDSNEFELSDIVAIDNRYSNILLDLDCIGVVDIMHLESVGSSQGLQIQNDQLCKDSRGMLNISSSLFEGARSYGIIADIYQGGYLNL